MLDAMTDSPSQKPEKKPVGNLVDFVEGVDPKNPLHVEVGLTPDARVIVFHDKNFTREVSWFEYDLVNNKLDFVMDDGDTRDFGLPLHPQIAKNMQNTHQILMVLLDDKTGEATEGNYIPLIIHQ
jgi:hypothetical protein